MHRTEGENNNNNMFTNGPPATCVEENWLNAVQEEIANVIELNGDTLDKNNNRQLYHAIQSFNRVGAIIMWPLETPPSGYLECDGSAISRTTYSSLFSLIGEMYGNGDGSTTFNLPDYRGRFLRGWDHGAGVDPDAASRTNRGDGVTGDHIGTKQSDELKSHSHDVPIETDNDTTGGDDYIKSGGVSTAGWIESTGGNETRPINTNVMFCIKY